MLCSHMTLPRRIPGLSGPITIKYVDEIAPEDDRLGTARMADRMVWIKTGQPPSALVNSLAHELMHHALWDSGQHRNFTDQQQEIICDLAGAMVAASKLVDVSE